jgi:hypothetical protein
MIVRAALTRYAASRWVRVDQFRTAPPERDVLLFRALRAGAGRVPSISHLRRLLISGRAMSSAADYNAADILSGGENGPIPPETEQRRRPHQRIADREKNARAEANAPQQSAANATAVDDLRAYIKYSELELAGLKKMLPALDTLYSALSPGQKKAADAVFRQGPGG